MSFLRNLDVASYIPTGLLRKFAMTSERISTRNAIVMKLSKFSLTINKEYFFVFPLMSVLIIRYSKMDNGFRKAEQGCTER